MGSLQNSRVSMQAEAQKWLYFYWGLYVEKRPLDIARKEEDVNLWWHFVLSFLWAY